MNKSFSFNPLQQYPPQQPNQEGLYSADSVAIGDITGDGRFDVVITASSLISEASTPDLTSQIMVFPQLSNGALGAPIQAAYLDHAGWMQASLTISDLDNDGAQEIIVAHQDGLSVAKFQSSTNSLDVTIINELGNFSSVVAADFDSDGKIDVIAQTWNTGAVLYRGNGKSELSRYKEIMTPLAGYNRIIARDMNQDNRPDLVMTNGQGWGSWYLMLNQGDGAFRDATPYTLPRRPSDNWPWMAWGVDARDLNGDGRRDVVTSLASNRPAGIGVFLAKPDGSYELDQILDSYDIPEPVTIADLDGNGLDDIITLHGGFFSMGYYLQGPNGFEPETLISVSLTGWPTSHYRPDGLAVGDINSDGCRDVAIADSQHGLLIRTGSNCRH
ncbi:VCBS repeat-containing protein [Thermomonas brevis]|uniref:VCBS repeat-containing protein n=1 Tax=Thermomonas brevis TaxID=215691 RepID=A0A7G9QV52_9GAMM|nr:VCBS repeat-containing protein [Thermomonas brevis]QNN47227.1 VCBS repeat-containing protein [Thermomonas brevis]